MKVENLEKVYEIRAKLYYAENMITTLEDTKGCFWLTLPQSSNHKHKFYTGSFNVLDEDNIELKNSILSYFKKEREKMIKQLEEL